ncbi:MAG: YihY family inner membrane protein [candidate division Zixibacteria bacterium]|nr:YihY family inner membrane protein [candidate division Zixibacteria bacterium]
MRIGWSVYSKAAEKISMIDKARVNNGFIKEENSFFSRFKGFWKVVWNILRDVYENTFFKDNVSLMAAAISFYAVLSIIPLMLVFVSIFGYILQSSEAAFQQVADFLVTIIPSSTTSIIDFLHDFVRKKGFFGAIGIVGLIWAGSRIFSAVENSINVVWKVESGRPFWKSKILSLVLVPASVLVLIFSIILTAIYAFAAKMTIPVLNINITDLSGIIKILQFVVPVFFSIVLFTLIYRFVPYRDVPWLSAVIGAVFAALFWETAKYLFDIYIKNYADYSKIYGSFGTLVVGVFWIYYSSFILLIGAEIGFAFEEHRTRSDFMRVFKKIDWLDEDDYPSRD